MSVPTLSPFSWTPVGLRTEMGGKGAVIEPHVSEFVTGILNIVTKLITSDVGTFYNYLGKHNPW
ncbi:hypothetical protein DFJ58DRAFT_218557 [Suillus subalutaceus]|uniref:uncharacterized protein n=1 Tax=Suillus subalutaceus TaxID=48586 RepID=UPI001B86CA29|nr:uncharacterized protein DFJ58DRAFT_218557 [Suillus subalutaceus]KAG1834311.1 hypothetical protein DFJ58DRAFT_218557 [Suillus subalutaceus]